MVPDYGVNFYFLTKGRRQSNDICDEDKVALFIRIRRANIM